MKKRFSHASIINRFAALAVLLAVCVVHAGDVAAKQLTFDFYLYPTSTTAEVKNNKFYVNGAEFFIKGAACNSLNYSAKGFNPFWAEASSAGANTIRTYSPYDLGGSRAAIIASLNRLYSMNLFVIMGVGVSTEESGFNYNDATARAQQINKLKFEIDICKGHPAIIAWCLGNECDQKSGTGSVNTNVWTDINELAAYVKSVDGRPTSTAITGIWNNRTTVADIKAKAPNLNFICVNNYEGAVESLHTNWTKSGIGKPYLLSEFGPRGTWDSAVASNSYGCLFEPTSSEKARSYRSIYSNNVVSHRSAGCLGSCVFLWGYQTHGAVQTWYTMFDHFKGYALSAVDVMHEMWTGTAVSNRCPVIAASTDLKIDGATTGATIEMGYGTRHTATVAAYDPDGDALTYDWYLTLDENISGKPIKGAFLGTTTSGEMTFSSPASKGNYRLIVYARDVAHAKTACASLPFTVTSSSTIVDGLPSDGNTDICFAPAYRPKAFNIYTPESKGITLNYSENLICAPDNDGKKHLLEYYTTNGSDAYLGEWTDALQLGTTSQQQGSVYLILGSRLTGVSKIDITARAYNITNDVSSILKVGMGKRNASSGEYDFTNTFNCTAINGVSCNYVTPTLSTSYNTYTFTTSGTADGQVLLKSYSYNTNYLRIKSITITYNDGSEVMVPLTCGTSAWMTADNEWSNYAAFSSSRDVVISSANNIVGTVRIADGKAQFLALPTGKYAVTAANAPSSTVTGYYIPANTGVLVRTHSQESCTACFYPAATTSAIVHPANSLVAMTNAGIVSASAGRACMRLAYDAEESTSNPGFYRADGFAADAGTAYLDVPADAATAPYLIANFEMMNSGVETLLAIADTGTSNYYATFSNLNSDSELIPADGASLTVYDVKIVNSTLELYPRSDCKVAKGEGVLVKCSTDALTAIPLAGESLVPASSAVTELVATPATAQTLNAPDGYKIYRLTYDNISEKRGLGFYWGNPTGTQISSKPGKAYLKVKNSSSSTIKGFRFGDADILHIEGIPADNLDAEGGLLFDLCGRRVENPAPGVYIQGNRKIIVK